MSSVSSSDEQVFTVIGDLIGSRVATDRAAVHDALVTALDAVNGEVPHVQRLEPTVGDEFQGAYRSLGEAVTAALLVRLEALPLIDVRAGVGCGDLTVFDANREPRLQDGPAWWAARDAIEEVGTRSKRPRASYLRTWFAGGDAVVVSTANAFLTCRDQLVSRLKPEAVELLRLSLLGATQAEMAGQLGISQSAVSQRLSTGGINALKDAHDLMRGMLG